MKYLVFFVAVCIILDVTLSCLPQCKVCQCSGKCPPGEGSCSGSGSYCYCSKSDEDFLSVDDYLYSKLIKEICKTFKNTSKPLILNLDYFIANSLLVQDEYVRGKENPVQLYCTENDELKIKPYLEEDIRPERTCNYKGVSYNPRACVTRSEYSSLYCCPSGGWSTCDSMYCENCNR